MLFSMLHYYVTISTVCFFYPFLLAGYNCPMVPTKYQSTYLFLFILKCCYFRDGVYIFVDS